MHPTAPAEVHREDDRRGDRASERLASWSQGLLLAVGGLAALATLATGLEVVGYRWEQLNVASEFINVFHAERLGAGDGLYLDPSPQTWSFPVYFPGLYLILAPFTLLDGSAGIWLERLLAVAALAGIAVLAWRTARRLGAGRWLALASGAAPFVFGPVSVVVGVVRPDVFALLFAAGALAAVTRWEDDGGERWIAIAAGLCAATLLTRQVYAPICLALCAAVVVRERGAGARLTLGIAALALLGIGLTQLASGGAFGDDQRAFTDLFSIDSLGAVAESELLPVPNAVYLVGAAGCMLGFSRRDELRAAHFAWLGGAVCCLAAVKVGSAANYFLPAMWASAVLVGPTLQWLRRAHGPRALAVAATALAAAVVAPAISASERALEFGDAVEPFESSYDAAVERIAGSGGEVLGDRFDLLQAAGVVPSYEPVLMAQIEVSGGTGAPQELARELEGRRFALLQASFDLGGPIPGYQGLPLWPPGVVAAARGAYCEAWSSDVVWLYEPCET